jgi:hypothetical protein
MVGFDAEKKNNERALSESQSQYKKKGACRIPNGQYSQCRSLMEKSDR